MGAFATGQDSQCLLHFQATFLRCGQAGDWEGFAASNSALLAVTKGKGEGKKGPPSLGATLSGACYDCDGWPTQSQQR